jgi:hypothetical protein
VYGVSNQFFAAAGFTRNHHGIIGGCDLHDIGKHRLQGRGGTHNFPKNECLIDLLPQHEVLVMKPVLEELNFFEGFLQVSSGLPLFRDVQRGPDKFHDLDRLVQDRMANVVDIFDRSVWKNDTIVQFKVSFRIMGPFIVLRFAGSNAGVDRVVPPPALHHSEFIVYRREPLI